jgi:hypothetical protein
MSDFQRHRIMIDLPALISSVCTAVGIVGLCIVVAYVRQARR